MRVAITSFMSLPLLLLLASCTLTKVSSRETLHAVGPNPLPESALLDIGITVLEPLQEDVDPEIGSVIDGLRFAESRYLSRQLALALQQSGHWGRVTLQPEALNRADLRVQGAIVQSDGQTLRMAITVTDASERLWFSRQYVQIVTSRKLPVAGNIPQFTFTPMFNRIANDMHAWQKRNLDVAELEQLRLINNLQYAREFVSEAYGGYLESDADGLGIIRLPALDDPVFSRVADIQERSNTLVDTLQDRYDLFVRGVEQPYLQFLDRSLRITEMINTWLLRLERDRQYSEFLDKDFVESFETRFIMARSPLVKSRSNSLNSGWRTEYYAMTLAEAGLSLDELVRPESEIFNERIVSLTNGAGVQYAQWKQILDELYELESGVAITP
jgi:hypothetical protein